MHRTFDILSYGGGRQTVAICTLVAKEVLPRPDLIVMADTGREAATTWAYLATHVQPMLDKVGLKVQVAPRSLATVDLYAHNGDLLLPVYTETGKMRGWCSGEWKREVCNRWLREQGVERGTLWIGYSLDERSRVTRMLRSERREKYGKRFPLVELMLTTKGCLEVIKRFGLPEPPPSSCWMCPNRRNTEWRLLRDESPHEFELACRMDEDLRTDDVAEGHTGVYLHHSRVPLRSADLDAPDVKAGSDQCGLGMCFV